MSTMLCKHGNEISVGPAIDFRICARCDAEKQTSSEEIDRIAERHGHRNKVKDSGALSIDLVADIRRLWSDHDDLLTIASRLREDMTKLLLKGTGGISGN